VFNTAGLEKKTSKFIFIFRPKTPLSKKMSLLQNMKAPTSIKKGHHINKTKQRRSQTRIGKHGGIQTPSKKKRTRK
jgi:hypothetical protein